MLSPGLLDSTLHRGVEDIPGDAGRGRGTAFRYPICHRAVGQGYVILRVGDHVTGFRLYDGFGGNTPLPLPQPFVMCPSAVYVTQTLTCPPVAAPEET